MPEILHAIIGTAGHIDHGKTALVKALTGCDTDRLKEEKERGISIDLGFAALELGDRRVGIVDVPGHERFIRNMLAGAHGIDLALLTVAADDGVMPQTEEHLDIVHLLGVRRGVIALTKTDLASRDRLRAVREEIVILVAGTRLESAPIIEVSAVTGAGVDELKAELDRQLTTVDDGAAGRFRLPVDRAFVLKGHGVVVTGTAIAGTITTGAEAHVLPAGRHVRVRRIENHGATVDSAGWRQRVALNLAGVERGDVTRGDVVADLGVTLVSERFDALVEVRPAAGDGIRNHARIRLHLGTAEALARIVLLDGNALLPPKTRGYAQIVPLRPVVAVRGDRFIMRAENGRGTLGGGEVVLADAERHVRGDASTLARLETVRTGPPAAAIAAVIELSSDVGLSPASIAERLGLGDRAMRAAIPSPASAANESGAGEGGIVTLGDAASGELWTTAARWRDLRATIVGAVAVFHREKPLEPGIEMEAVRASLSESVTARIFRDVVDRLASEGLVVRRDSVLASPDHRVRLGKDKDLAGRIVARLDGAGFAPPELRLLEGELGVPRRRLVDVLGVLEKSGQVVRVSDELYYSADAITRTRAALEDVLRDRETITAAELRDRLDVSRKFSIALLDYFDRTGVTLRVGDARKLRRSEHPAKEDSR